MSCGSDSRVYSTRPGANYFAISEAIRHKASYQHFELDVKLYASRRISLKLKAWQTSKLFMEHQVWDQRAIQ